MTRSVLVMLICACLWSGSAVAGGNTGSRCESAWERVVGGSVSPQVGKQIAYWKGLAPQCAGDGLYEYRLANLYARGGHYDAAQTTLSAALAKKLPHRRELLLAMADVASARGDLDGSKAYCDEIVDTYPDWYAGYQEMGLIEFQEQNFKESIPYFVKANGLEENWYTYRNLSIAYFYTNQNEQAINAFKRAYMLNNGAAGDRIFMLIGANAYLNGKQYKSARDVLSLLAQKNPAAKSDQAYVRMNADIAKNLRK